MRVLLVAALAAALSPDAFGAMTIFNRDFEGSVNSGLSGSTGNLVDSGLGVLPGPNAAYDAGDFDFAVYSPTAGGTFSVVGTGTPNSNAPGTGVFVSTGGTGEFAVVENFGSSTGFVAAHRNAGNSLTASIDAFGHEVVVGNTTFSRFKDLDISFDYWASEDSILGWEVSYQQVDLSGSNVGGLVTESGSLGTTTTGSLFGQSGSWVSVNLEDELSTLLPSNVGSLSLTFNFDAPADGVEIAAFDNLVISGTSTITIPEPGTIGLAGLASMFFGGFVARRRMRKQADEASAPTV